MSGVVCGIPRASSHSSATVALQFQVLCRQSAASIIYKSRAKATQQQRKFHRVIQRVCAPDSGNGSFRIHIRTSVKPTPWSTTYVSTSKHACQHTFHAGFKSRIQKAGLASKTPQKPSYMPKLDQEALRSRSQSRIPDPSSKPLSPVERQQQTPIVPDMKDEDMNEIKLLRFNRKKYCHPVPLYPEIPQDEPKTYDTVYWSFQDNKKWSHNTDSIFGPLVRALENYRDAWRNAGTKTQEIQKMEEAERALNVMEAEIEQLRTKKLRLEAAKNLPSVTPRPSNKTPVDKPFGSIHDAASEASQAISNQSKQRPTGRAGSLRNPPVYISVLALVLLIIWISTEMWPNERDSEKRKERDKELQSKHERAAQEAARIRDNLAKQQDEAHNEAARRRIAQLESSQHDLRTSLGAELRDITATVQPPSQQPVKSAINSCLGNEQEFSQSLHDRHQDSQQSQTPQEQQNRFFSFHLWFSPSSKQNEVKVS